MLLVFTLLASPLYVFLREQSGSVLVPAVCHGSFSASMLLTFAPVAGGGELTSGLIALPGILVMLIVNLVLFFIVRRASPLLPLSHPSAQGALEHEPFGPLRREES